MRTKARSVRVLVVDDDRAVRAALKVNLSKAGIEVVMAESAEAALELVEEHPVDLVLTDVRMPGLGGLELLAALRPRHPEIEVVVMTGYGNVDDAVAAMKAGAADYIIKPVSKQELLVIIERALEARDLRAEVVALRREVKAQWGLPNIVGSSQAMQRVQDLVHAVAGTDALVLLQGETGTGKDLVARAIHQLSERHAEPYVRVNCAALPDTLLESELFGHEKGSFTGAIRNHQGRFEQAEGGTLFLDEIGDISPAMQVKLLHVLESHEFQRLGGRDTLRADVRIVAATNRDLRQRVLDGEFRKDLYYRLEVFTIRLPQLRERLEDLPALVQHFLERQAERSGRAIQTVSAEVMSQLQRHAWPGNVRELEHVLARAAILSPSGEIRSIELSGPHPLNPPAPSAPPPSGDIVRALEDLERGLIIAALREADGIQAKAARALGISRSNMHYRIKKLGIDPEGL
jgi:two-component system response regulator PilR (NtrC family)